MQRSDGRAYDELRPCKITKYFQKYPAGSVLIEMGNTKVICAASIEDRVPVFQRGTGIGWLRAEYSLLPSATGTRTARESARGKQTGRTQEIQRLIGRSLRSVLDFKALGERTVILDCDVIQADGGTRTASVTGSFVALVLALDSIIPKDKTFPVKDFVSAVSVGISEQHGPILDLCYEEDSAAMVDMNVVMTESGDFVEIQGTAEGGAFSHAMLGEMLGMAQKGIGELIHMQKRVLGLEEY